jgi:hypothetical protein
MLTITNGGNEHIAAMQLFKMVWKLDIKWKWIRQSMGWGKQREMIN